MDLIAENTFASTITIFIITVAFLTSYISWKGYYSKKRPFYFGPLTPLVYTILGIFLTLLFVDYFFSQNQKLISKYENRISYLHGNSYYDNDVEYFDTLIGLDSSKVIFYVQKWLSLNKRSSSDSSTIKQKKKYEQDLLDLANTNNACKAATANRVLAQISLYDNNKNEAKIFLQKASNCFSEGDFIALADVYLGLSKPDKAKEALQKEIELKGKKKQAYAKLLTLYQNENDSTALRQMLLSFDGILHVNSTFQRRYWWAEGSVGSYLMALTFTPINNANIPIIFISFVIVLLLSIYFIMLDIYDREPFGQLIGALFIGAMLTPLVLIFYDFNDVVLRIGFNGTKLDKIAYTFFVNAMSEEVLKSLTLLIAIKFFKNVREPIDYIIYAAMGALGFAFTENIIYFTRYGAELIVPRAMFSTLGHVTDSAILAYTIVYFKFKLKKPILVGYLVGLPIAALTHAIFNLLANGNSFLILYFFICTAVLGGIINNSLNNSQYHTHLKVLNNDTLMGYIISVYLMVYLAYFLFNIWQNDVQIALVDFYENLTYTVFVILAITRFLSSYDIVKGRWRNLFKYLAFRHINLNESIGQRVYFETDRLEDIHYDGLLEGVITDRLVVEDDERFFLVKTDIPYIYEDKQYNFVLIKTIRRSHIIVPDTRYAVFFIVPVADIIKIGEANNNENFEFVGYAFVRCPAIDYKKQQQLA